MKLKIADLFESESKIISILKFMTEVQENAMSTSLFLGHFYGSGYVVHFQITPDPNEIFGRLFDVYLKTSDSKHSINLAQGLPVAKNLPVEEMQSFIKSIYIRLVEYLLPASFNSPFEKFKMDGVEFIDSGKQTKIVVKDDDDKIILNYELENVYKSSNHHRAMIRFAIATALVMNSKNHNIQVGF